MLEVLEFDTSKRNDLIDITAEVSAAISRSRIESGICCLYVPHATSGVTINENADPSVRLDIIKKLIQIRVKIAILYFQQRMDARIQPFHGTF